MNIKEKIKKTRWKSWLAQAIVILTMIYLLMVLIKSLYILSIGSSFEPVTRINQLLELIIIKSSVYHFSILWELIPNIAFNTLDIILFYKVISPPIIIMLICSFFISDYQQIKQKIFLLKEEIEKEIALKELRKEAGIETISENATIDVIVSNTNDSAPLWHETWWGRIFIGIAIIIIATTIGIK